MFAESCLLIIDFQDFFIDENSKGYVDGAVAFKSRFEKVIRFFLERNYPVLATRHFNSEELDDPFYRFYGRVIEKDSPGFRVSEPVRSFAEIELFEKSNYSIFTNPDFSRRLRQLKVRNIFLAGALAEKCVLATAFDAFQAGYNVYVISDCLISRYPSLSKGAVEMIENACGKSLRSDDLLGRAG